MLVHERFIGVGFFYGIEVVPLEVLDQRDLEHVAIISVTDDRRDAHHVRLLGRAPAAFAGDYLESLAHPPDDNRLEHAVRFDRGHEFGEFSLVEIPARLERIGLDLVQHDILPGRSLVPREILRFTDQRLETLTKRLLLHCRSLPLRG